VTRVVAGEVSPNICCVFRTLAGRRCSRPAARPTTATLRFNVDESYSATARATLYCEGNALLFSKQQKIYF